MKHLTNLQLYLFIYDQRNGIEICEGYQELEKEFIEDVPTDAMANTIPLGHSSIGLMLGASVLGQGKPQELTHLKVLKQRILQEREKLVAKGNLVARGNIGETWMIVGSLPVSHENDIHVDITAQETIVREAYEGLFLRSGILSLKPQKIMGASFFEVWKPSKNESTNDEKDIHVLIGLYPNLSAQDKIVYFFQDFLYLFYYRNSVFWGYRKSPSIKGFLDKHFLSDETNTLSFIELSQYSSLSESKLQPLKATLDTNYVILCRYAELISLLENLLQTLKVNLENYRRRLTTITEKAREEGDTDSDFLRDFIDIATQKYQAQLEKNITLLSIGLKVRETLISNIRGMVQIRQTELNERIETRDRQFQQWVAIVGVGAGVSSVVASAASNYVKALTNSQSDGLNLLVAIVLSTGTGLMFSGLTALLSSSSHTQLEQNEPIESRHRIYKGRVAVVGVGAGSCFVVTCLAFNPVKTFTKDLCQNNLDISRRKSPQEAFVEKLCPTYIYIKPKSEGDGLHLLFALGLGAATGLLFGILSAFVLWRRYRHTH